MTKRQSDKHQRKGVCRDLHDGICQQLTGLRLIASSLQRKLARANPEAARL
ncbi:MAG: hypothetical protein ISS31_04630 [Kiritimatiellae bacterium]|nr:hypothetical protein [Kiritimatiellia bacterium]